MNYLDKIFYYLLGRNGENASRDLVNDNLSGLAIDLGANGLSGTEDLLDGTLELLGKGLGTHLTSDLDDLAERNVSVVFDVLLLLLITRSLLESSNDESGSSRNKGDSGLTVLDLELDCDVNTSSVLLGGLDDIITDLLGGETQRTELGSQGSGVGLLTSNTSDGQVPHFIRVDLRSHGNV